VHIRLPKRENISVTSSTDPTLLHYKPLVGYFMNKRLEGALKLLSDEKCPRLLDIGCGGGVFLPELSHICDELYGIDIHQNLDKVKEMLKKEKISATISFGDVTKLIFPDSYFDRIVCLSVLEFVGDLDKAFSEMARVLKPGGDVVIGFPVINIFTEIGYLAIGINARAVHKASHSDILTASQKNFSLDTIESFPLGLPLNLALFAHCRLRKKNG
jgi:ubiquinone/menaquinone biosynthesis C-methylase UbiE